MKCTLGSPAPRSTSVGPKFFGKILGLSWVLPGCLLLFGCTPRAPSTQSLSLHTPVQTLPEAFAAPALGEESFPADSAARLDWRELFSDPKLQALIEAALESNQEVQVLAAKIDAIGQEVLARSGEYRPFVGIGADSGIERVGEHTRAGAVESGLTLPGGKAFPKWLGDHRLGLVASWEVDAWKKLRNARKVAVLEYAASQEGMHFLRTNLIAEVARSYFELLALDNQLSILNQNIQLQVESLAMAEKLKANARSNALAVSRYQAEVAKNRAHRFTLAQEITEVENRLHFLLGRSPTEIPRSSSTFLDSQPEKLASGVPMELLQNRPDIRRAELELEATDVQIQVARAAFFPRIEIRAGLGLESAELGHLFSPGKSLAGSILGGFVSPWINRRALKAGFQTAGANQRRAAYELEQTILKAFYEVSNQLAKIGNLEKGFANMQENVDYLQKSTEVAFQLFRSARAEYLEVLLTQREALEAKQDWIELKRSQFLAVVDLYKALGGGWRGPKREEKSASSRPASAEGVLALAGQTEAKN